MPDDIALLKDYAETHSEPAFAELVSRYLNLVYSVALRRTGNSHAAQEISQAVFIILAQKAKSLSSHTALSGWLYQTARLTAQNYLRTESRRQNREQEAFMQSTLTETNPELWPQIAPLLDDAMGRLGERDRSAIVQRFFENKSLREVGVELGASEEAAKMRVSRALEKLRIFFARRGVKSTAAAISENISRHSIQIAPAGLAKTVTAAALAKGATASISVATLAKATLIAMKTKIIVAGVVTTVLLLGIGGYVAYKSTARPPAAPVTFLDAVPMNFANSVFTPDGNRDGTFIVEVDPNTRRTTNSAPAIHIKGPIADDGTVTNNGNMGSDNSSSTKYFVTDQSVLYGKRIRLTGWLKTSDLKGWGSAFMIILGLDGTLLKVDSMGDRFIYGATDWQQVEFVTDVPKQPCIIYFGPDLYGPGELWGDDFQIDLAPADEPVTDDSAWCQTTQSRNTYTETMDFKTEHDGHPTVCLADTLNGAPPRGQWTWWGRKIRPPDCDKYIGHTMRMTGWIKTENVSGRLEPTIRPWNANGKYGRDSMTKDNSLKGTRDWTKFTVTCVIPDDTLHIDTAFILYGSGKVWIDLD